MTSDFTARLRRGAWVWLILASLLVFGACDDGKKAAGMPELSASEWVGQGKTALSAGDYSTAEYDFLQALAKDKANTDALYGLSLVSVQQSIALVDLALSVTAEEGKEPTPVDGDVETAVRKATVELLDGLLSQQDQQLARLEALKGMGELRFTLDHFPVKIKGTEIADLHGVWTTSDLYLLSALAHTLRGVVGLVATQNVNDLDDVIAALLGGEAPKASLTRLLPALLVKYPELLTLRSDGAARWAQSAADLKLAAQDLLEAGTRIGQETGDVSERVFGVAVKGEVISLKVHGSYPSKVENLLLLWQGKKYSLKESAERLVSHLNGTPDTRLRGDKDVLLALLIVVDALRQSMGLEGALAAFGLTLDSSTMKLLAGIDQETGEDLPGTLLPMLPIITGMKPSAIELDLATFYSRPLDLRLLMPAYTESDPIAKLPLMLTSPECILTGFAAATATPGEALSLFAFDDAQSSLASLRLAVSAYKQSEPGERHDFVNLGFNATQPGTGLFSASLPTRQNESATEDDALDFLAGDLIAIDTVEPDGVGQVVLPAISSASLPLFDLGAACPKAALGDRAHFASVLFASVPMLPDPPAAAMPTSGPYPLYPADGLAASWPSLAFPSPSFNGLLWVKVADLPLGKVEGCPDGLSLATACSTGALLGGVEKLISGFAK